MLNHFRGLKYLLAVVLIFGLAVFISQEYQRTREQCRNECEQVNPGAVAPPSPSKDCDKCEKDAERNFPRWYRLFSWPEGIQNWAILLTLLAIAEQTHETRRAARAAEANIDIVKHQVEIENKTLVLQFRPRLVIRHAIATGFPAEINKPISCRLEFRLVNSGGSPAHIINGSVQLLAIITDRQPIELVDSTNQLQIGSATLQPGEQSTLIGEHIEIGIITDADWASYFLGDSSHRRIILIGNVWYRDDIGIKRQTGLYRNYDPKTGQFPANTNSEQEYSD